MRSSYRGDDVTILLKDITGMVDPLENKVRERYIQSGTPYSAMLPLEHLPSPKYMRLFYDALTRYSSVTATAVASVATKIYHEKGRSVVLVSLARAGTSIGILIKHYMEKYFAVSPVHYTISIIRGQGIDRNAMRYILTRHAAEEIQFVDGWTGKGAIRNQLKEAMHDYPAVDSGLAVLSDPAYVAAKCGTHDDFLIASSCLNSTVSGLISRTFYRPDIIGADDFHGAMYYEKFKPEDLTYRFLDAIEAEFQTPERVPKSSATTAEVHFGIEEVRSIMAHFDINDINLIKPSIGEATRVCLRRIPWKILVHSLHDDEHLGHLYELAREKGVPVEVYPLKNYRACGLIKELRDV